MKQPLDMPTPRFEHEWRTLGGKITRTLGGKITVGLIVIVKYSGAQNAIRVTNLEAVIHNIDVTNQRKGMIKMAVYMQKE